MLPRGRLFKTVLCSFFDEMRRFNQFLVKLAAALNGRKNRCMVKARTGS